MKVDFTKDELQMISDALFPFWLKTVITVNDTKMIKTHAKLEKKLEALLG